MTPEQINDIVTGGTSTQPSPVGGPSNTPVPWGTNDPTATTNPGSGSGAPTTMPKQDIGGLIGMLSSDVYRARLATHEGRAKLEESDTILNRVAAELSALERNPPDRKLRADQLVFLPRLLALIKSARSAADPGSSTAAELTEAEWIVNMIQKL